MATLADVCPHHETERGAAAKVLGRTGSEGVRGSAGGFVNKVGRAVCGLRFADASRIIPRFGGLRSEICRLAPWIVWDSLANSNAKFANRA